MNYQGPERKRIRLDGYDYSTCGYYFVTICTHGREEFFGEIRNGIMGLNEIGCVAARCWQEIPDHYPFIRLDEWVVMPNHVHGIVCIAHDPSDTGSWVGPRDLAALQWRMSCNAFGPLQKRSLSSVIHGFKSSVKRWCNKNNHPDFAWQYRFHDHVIRDDESLFAIRRYIRENPVKWERDRNNIERFGGDDTMINCKLN